MYLHFCWKNYTEVFYYVNTWRMKNTKDRETSFQWHTRLVREQTTKIPEQLRTLSARITEQKHLHGNWGTLPEPQQSRGPLHKTIRYSPENHKISFTGTMMYPLRNIEATSLESWSTFHEGNEVTFHGNHEVPFMRTTNYLSWVPWGTFHGDNEVSTFHGDHEVSFKWTTRYLSWVPWRLLPQNHQPPCLGSSSFRHVW